MNDECGRGSNTELLAPAGDWEALRAAVAAGADAVYLGLANYNARHRATNFTIDELPEVMGFLHARQVRGYITCNTLIFSDELEDVAELVARVAEAGADALIVQDMGLAQLVARLAPGLAVHGSTQMTLTESRGIEFVRALGVERVILARELSIDDIRQIRAATDVPVEVFVHGAMCVAYSGQCLTSEALGGRSANRGQCAQACRLPYELIVDGQKRDLGDVAYLLSPQDLAAYDLVDQLVELGVVSLKIEGRLKNAQYVSVATQTYRQALDAAIDHQPYAIARQQQLDLTQSFSRGFAPGFLAGVNHQRLVHGRFPKARGVRVGRLLHVAGQRAIVRLDAEHEADILKPGDGIVFDEGHPEQNEQGGRVYGARVVEDSDGLCLELEFGREGGPDLANLSPGCLIWRTDDPQLRRRTERTYASDVIIRRSTIAVHISGQPGGPLEVRLRDESGSEAVVSWPGPLELARKHPLGEPLVREQFGRLGETQFELGAIELDLPQPVMVPKSVLNDLRRQAVGLLTERVGNGRPPAAVHREALTELRAQIDRAVTPSPLLGEGRGEGPQLRGEGSQPRGEGPQLYVLVRSLEQLDAVLRWQPPAGTLRPAMVYCDFEDVRRYGEAIARLRAEQMPAGLAALRIIKQGEEGWLAQLQRRQPDAVLVRNLATLEYFRQHAPEIQRIGDFALNIANELTADAFRRSGLVRAVPSYDLNWDQLSAMLGRSVPHFFEVVVHQHMPMFHMEHCVFAATMSDGKDWRDCGRPCDRHRVELRDRAGANFPLLADTGCRNTVFNAVPQSAVELLSRMRAAELRHFRVELLRETGEQVAPLLDRYARAIAGLETGRDTWRGLQVLNQLGVTRGTFQLD
ncbi:MAG TPA: U32 family peptidase [Pirellulales bacterium]|jgi:putative protease|nr:U32 family peptidase [Pirellulales bacterium]